jgi:hypothetical protein
MAKSIKSKAQAIKLKKTIKQPVIALGNLRKWNIVLAVLNVVQGVLILVLSKSAIFSVTTSYITTDTLASKINGHSVSSSSTHHLFDVNMVYLIVAFFFLSAIAHLLAVTIYRSQYEEGIAKGINKLRWVEFAINGGIMLLIIGLLSGIYDFSSLLMIFVFNIIINITALVIETHNQSRQRNSNSTLITGSLASILPWLVLAFYLIGTNIYGSGGIPAFVYWIYFSILILFGGLIANMFLISKKKSLWVDYLYGERIYMILSLAIKTLLAWQIFAGILRS